jgi:microcystin-dependent protein
MKPYRSKTSRPAVAVTIYVIALAFACWLGGPPRLSAEPIPEAINYQGILLDGQGVPITTITAVKFRIYDTAMGTNVLWGRMFTITPAPDGAFNVLLSDDGAQISDAPTNSLFSVFTASGSDSRFLELTVGSSAPIRPRQQFVAAPYAILARDVVKAQQDFTVANALTVNGPANLTGGLTASTLSVNGAANVGSLTVTGNVTASNFVGYGTIPIGGIIMWSGTNPPAGWALCNGQTTNGISTPDLRGRFVLASGQGTGLSMRTVGQSGGKETHALTIGEVPSHTHTNTFIDNGYPDNWGRRDDTLANGHFMVKPTSSGHSANFTGTAAGGSGAHTNMPPYYVLAFIMRVQ